MKNPNPDDTAPNPKPNNHHSADNGRLRVEAPGPASAAGGGAAGGGVVEECSNCGTKKGWVLHNVRYRATLRRLCTSCVLRLHPASFCPICFLFQDHSNSQNAPPPNLVSCSKCPSLSHSDCLPPYAAFSPSPFLCPPCASANPKFSFFELDDRNKVLDKRLAAVLLCAASIAASSMSKAAAISRAEAERRVREAASARKRAREALDRFVLLSSGSSFQPGPVVKAAAAAAAHATEVSGSSNGGKEPSKNKTTTPVALTNKAHHPNGGLHHKQEEKAEEQKVKLELKE
ncbi:putative chromatin regulator PHD family [Rosa chinensis]|uniref:Putative chromatin regulator PHD family n=1 Tax=Rosa chinensis TaxID=74649 RepID=A0A2P6R7V3_ROSCH|nr:uncharacterized protein LOC112195231 [Rosa chinensis]PRQ42508.1 putative chromatin regulator PHD family [Rosa chinensis]